MWLDALTDLFFPPRCAECDAPGSVICDACLRQLPLIGRDSACPRCGAPVIHDSCGCSECAGRSFSFSGCRCVGLFRPGLSDMVTVYKDGGEHRLAPVISALMVECLGQWLQWAESIVPVPPRPGAMSTRGFDHMRAIARHVARETGLPIQTVLVARTVADQRTLGREDRLANTVGRYEMRRDAKVSGRLLVLDDVFTTGATLEACSLALLAAGASEVRGCTVARATDVAVS